MFVALSQSGLRSGQAMGERPIRPSPSPLRSRSFRMSLRSFVWIIKIINFYISQLQEYANSIKAQKAIFSST